MCGKLNPLFLSASQIGDTCNEISKTVRNREMIKWGEFQTIL